MIAFNYRRIISRHLAGSGDYRPGRRSESRALRRKASDIHPSPIKLRFLAWCLLAPGLLFCAAADAALRELAGSNFILVLRDYVACCRRRGGDLDLLLGELDRLSRTKLFSDHYRRFQVEEGFPDVPREIAGHALSVH